jgi:hypothetical protein
MANKKGAKESNPAGVTETIGSTVDNIAPVGSKPAKARKKGKLIKKKTSRLPRKQKKAQQKAAAAKS